MDNKKPPYDQVITHISEYVTTYSSFSQLSIDTAYYDLLDACACALLALSFPACTRLLGPVVPGATLEQGANILGTHYQLEPVQAAFNLGAMIRWLDFNDTWLAAEWGHPADNLGGLLALTDYLNQTPKHLQHPITIKELLQGFIKACEIQGCLALENSFNRVGIDHVVLVKVATTAVATHFLGGNKDAINCALSQAWVDGQSLRTYRHAPNTGSRKSWAAGDATSRGVRLALLTMLENTGYPTALTASQYGFYDASFRQHEFKFQRPYGCYVIENMLFKIAYPAEFHGQTAIECALKLYPEIKNRLNEIEKIVLQTQESAMRIINKTGPLHNPADRDHCIQYMVAAALIYGEITAKHYEDDIAANPLIDILRHKIEISENIEFSQDYLDPEKRAIGNSLMIFFADGSHTDKITVNYPIGHRKRRQEGIPLLLEKFHHAVKQHFSPKQSDAIIQHCEDKETILNMPVHEFTKLFTPTD